MEKIPFEEYHVISQFLKKHSSVSHEDLLRVSKAVVLALKLNGTVLNSSNIHNMTSHDLRNTARQMGIDFFREMTKEELRKKVLDTYNSVFNSDIPTDVLILPPLRIGNSVESSIMDAHDICRYEEKYPITEKDEVGSFMRFFKHVCMFLFYKVYRNLRWYNQTWYAYRNEHWQMVTGPEEIVEEYFKITENSCLSFSHLETFDKIDILQQRKFLNDFLHFVKKQSNVHYVSIMFEPPF